MKIFNCGALKFLFKDTLLYGVLSAASRIFTIFTVPLITRIFSKAEFGSIDGFNVLSQLFIAIIIMGMDSAVARFFFEYEEEVEKKSVVTKALIFVILLGISITILLFIFSRRVLTLYFGEVIFLKEF